jgi:hypothetical protein
LRSLLHQLENNEAVLLMYLAGELPPPDRAEFEQMLATDAGLRAERDRLAEVTARLDDALAKLDAADRRLPPADAAARRVGRMAARWHADRLAAEAARRPARPVGRVSRWTYPLAAAAACALISLGLWWASSSDSRRRPYDPVATTEPATQDVPGEFDASFAGKMPFLDLDPEAEPESPAPDGGDDRTGGDGSTSVATAWTERFDALEADLLALSTEAQTTTFFADPEPEPESDGL